MDSQNQSNIQTPSDELNRFRVVLRVRPFLDDELTGGKKGKQQCIQFYNDNQSLSMIRPNQDVRNFKFDCVLDQESDQIFAYDQIAYPVVQDVLNGFNGVVMAYGQTGSGKTHTIFGSRASLDHLYAMKGQGDLHEESGIVPRCVTHLFDYIKINPNKAQFRVTMSFLEIYNEQITDLLLQTNNNNNGSTSPGGGLGSSSHTRNQSHSPIRAGASSTSIGSQSNQGVNLKIREDTNTGIYVDGLTQVNVKSKDQLYQLIKIGAKQQRWIENQDGPAKDDQNRNVSPQRNSRPQFKKRHHKKALLTIVDLAGSERLSKTGSEGLRLQEAKNINKSIAALSNCISALASENKNTFVPFRDSKLTRLLTHSLGGNCKTTICACISPSLIHYDESFSTLLFAARAMSVRTYVTMNEKIEYKPIDEYGRSLTPGSSGKFQQTPNEKVLLKQNSKLQEETEELRQEIQTLREQIKKQQSMVSSFTTMPNNGTPGPYANQFNPAGQNNNLNNYNSNNTHNTSMDGNQNAAANNWGFKQNNHQSRNSAISNQTQQQIARSQSPNPSHQYNPIILHQMSGKNQQIFGTVYMNGSPQKTVLMQQPVINQNGFMLNQITPQDSETFQPMDNSAVGGAGTNPPTAQGISVNNSYQHMNNLKQSHQVYLQQQKDAQLTQKLVGIVDTLQDELTFKTLQVNQLMEENLKLKQFQGLQNDGNIQNNLDILLSNPSFRAALFERLSKQNY